MALTAVRHQLAYAKSASSPISFMDYMQVVDWTGRAVRDDKTGAIPANIALLLDRLGIESISWVDNIQHCGRRYYRSATR